MPPSFVDFFIVSQGTFFHQGSKWRKQLGTQIDDCTHLFVVLPLFANMLEKLNRCTGEDDITTSAVFLFVTVLIIFIVLEAVFVADAELAHFARELGLVLIDNDILQV